MEALKREEAARMNWCLCDVTRIYGEAGLHTRTDAWGGGDVKVFYPDGADHAQALPGQPAMPEPVPTPAGTPGAPVPTPSSAPGVLPPLPQPGNQPLVPTPTPSGGGAAAPAPGDPISSEQPYGAPSPAADTPIYPPVRPPAVIEPAGYQRYDANQQPPNPSSPQAAVYQQPVGPAPYQAPYNQ
jgi:hypothetical protein